MTVQPGDIVLFQNAVAGKLKFHLCICIDASTDLHSLIFLNSEGGFRDQFEIDCGRLPEMKESRTGRTVFDCPTVHRKRAEQIAKLNPKPICRLTKDVAAEFLEFARSISSMTKNDKAALIGMLEALLSEE